MKYGTQLFIKVLAGLCQQELITPQKKRQFVSEWQKADMNNNLETKDMLMSELKSMNSNRVWDSEMNKFLATIREM